MFLRVTIAAVILIGVVHLRGQRMPSSIRTWGAYLVMGALNNAIPFSLIVWGQTRLDTAQCIERVTRCPTCLISAKILICRETMEGLLKKDEHRILLRRTGIERPIHQRWTASIESSKGGKL